VALDHHAPHVVTSHIRDAVVWEHPRGAVTQSVAMGDGSIGMDEWPRQFQEGCPDATFLLEIPTGGLLRVMDYLEPEFWEDYPDTLAPGLAVYVQLVRRGCPFVGHMLAAERDERPPEYRAALVVQEHLDLERSLRSCQEVLGIG
jgi:hypothetical protein